ncbi:energy transducer TonB [Geminicoccaceae bacterium 1502E]|nr:energy transducer TonB [Geminicoccaceae bacterium 1502E]
MRRSAPDRLEARPRRRAGWSAALALSAAFHAGLAMASLLLLEERPPLPEPAGITVGIVLESTASGGGGGAEAEPAAEAGKKPEKEAAEPQDEPARGRPQIRQEPDEPEPVAEPAPALPEPPAAGQEQVPPPPPEPAEAERAVPEPLLADEAPIEPAAPEPPRQDTPPPDPALEPPARRPAPTMPREAVQEAPPPAAADTEPTASSGAGENSGPASEAATTPGVRRQQGAGTAASGPVALAGNPQPDYPPLARRRGLEGRVLLRIAVGADGAVRDVAVVEGSGHRLLDEAALEAVARWRFRPASDGVTAVAGTVDLPISFRLR